MPLLIQPSISLAFFAVHSYWSPSPVSHRCNTPSSTLTVQFLLKFVSLFKNFISESRFSSEGSATPAVNSKPKLIIYLHLMYLIYSCRSNLQAHSDLLFFFFSSIDSQLLVTSYFSRTLLPFLSRWLMKVGCPQTISPCFTPVIHYRVDHAFPMDDCFQCFMEIWIT